MISACRLFIYLAIVSPLAFQLSGCGAIVAGAFGGAVAANDRRPSTVMLEDEAIELTAVDLLYNKPDLVKTTHVNVTSYNHVVLLTGEALSDNLRHKTVEVVRNINRVKRVFNEIRIADLATFESRSKDTWITSKVKARMLTTDNFDATRIKVVTENRVVYLMGLISHDQGTQAAELARHIDGVERVVKLFEYRPSGEHSATNTKVPEPQNPN